MEEHIENMKARETAAKNSQKQLQVTHALNSLIQHALMINGMPEAKKKYDDYYGAWQDAWDYLNQFVLTSTCKKLTQFYATVQQTLDIINQPIYDRKFGQFGNLLSKFKQLAQEFTEPHNLLETHTIYCELYKLYSVHIIPLSLSIFNSAVDALPNAEIYIEQIDSMVIINPERIDFSDKLDPVSKPVQKKLESNIAFDDDSPPQLLNSESDDDNFSEASASPPASDDDIAIAIVMSLTEPLIPIPPNLNNNNNIHLPAAAAAAQEDEELRLALAMSVSLNERPVNVASAAAPPRLAPLLTRAREFFAQLGKSNAPPPPQPSAPEESSSDTEEVVKEFRANFW